MRTIIAACLSILITTLAQADFKMPENVFRMDQIEKAKAEAKSTSRAIAIVFTHEKTTCGLCQVASLKAARMLGEKAVVVYANSDSEWGKLPDTVQNALRSPESGPYVPKVVILDVHFKRVFAIIPSANGEEYDRLLREAMNKFR